MKIYNTLRRQVQEITPLKDDTFRIYSCGPTVYDHAHIGNLSAYIFADTLRRALALGHKVKHVMNYTDIDDKTIRRSREKYPELEPRQALARLTGEYIALFLDDMQKVGNDTAVISFMRATDSIEQMKELITRLHQGGFAYTTEDGVYFSIEAYRKAGKKYGQLSEITAGTTSEARIQNDEYDKESAHDFSLWKKQKDGEPAWEFTLDGKDLSGRPGWHIECSAMSREALEQPFDIHTGGIDLIFPHHENEIAQSTALEQDPVMAQAFAHNAHILVDGRKMSKSARNFYTLQDIIDRGYDPLAFRLLILQAHYRSAVNFTWESLEAAQNRLRAFRAMADLRFQIIKGSEYLGADYPQYQGEMNAALEDDLNTSLALASLSGAEANSSELIVDTGEEAAEFMEFLDFADKSLGLRLLESKDITSEQKQLIAEREETKKQAKQTGDWSKPDALRAKLTEQGIGLRDTPNGPVWFRTK